MHQRRIPAVKSQVTADLVTIVNTLRAHGYAGKLVLVDYYAPVRSTDPEATDIATLNTGIAAAASQTHVPFANTFAAFTAASSAGDPCAAGLLIVDPNGSCEVHPSPKGQALIATTITSVVGPLAP